MGKSNRKKRLEKQEFRKIKLKAGKKKLAANATSTNFKTQSIYIREQLKAPEHNGLLSHSKQSLSELLCHVNHFSPNFRYRALVGIKEIMQQNKTTGTYDVGCTMLKVSKTMIDEDADVRKICIALLQFFFSELSEKNMSPYFSLVLSHLFCAMSHLSAEVQKDSLKIVELILKYYPKLIRQHASTKLLQYFLELISTKENTSKSSNRILLMTYVHKKETAVQWRNKVLSQICALLEITKSEELIVGKLQEEMVHWDHNNLNINLLSNQCSQRGFTIEDFNQSCIVVPNQPSKRDVMEIIIPLLIQCWTDACASDLLHKDVDTLSTMTYVLSITNLLCKDVCDDTWDSIKDESWLHETYLPIFKKYFFSSFPFEQPQENERIKKRKGKTKIHSNKTSISLINLLVCNLSAFFISNKDLDTIFPSLEYITEYLVSAVKSSQSIEKRHIEIILTCLEQFFSYDGVVELSSKVLDGLYAYSASSKSSSQSRNSTLQFIMKLFEKYPDIRRKSAFETLLTNLPSLFLLALKEHGNCQSDLCKINQNNSATINMISILRCMQCAFRRKDILFCSSMSQICSEILRVIDKKYSNAFCPAEKQCIKCANVLISILACCLAQVELIKEKDFIIFADFCCNQQIPVASRTVVIDILSEKIIPNSSSYFSLLSKNEISNFLKFLLTTLIGSKASNSTFKDFNDLSSHADICEHVCCLFKRLSAINVGLWKALVAFFQKKLEVVSKPNKISMIGLMKLGKILTEQEEVIFELKKFGSFLAIYATDNSNLPEWKIEIEKSFVDLLRIPEIFESFLKTLTACESKSNVSALLRSLEFTDLQESFVESSTTLLSYISRIDKKYGGDEVSATVEYRKLKAIITALCRMA